LQKKYKQDIPVFDWENYQNEPGFALRKGPKRLRKKSLSSLSPRERAYGKRANPRMSGIPKGSVGDRAIRDFLKANPNCSDEQEIKRFVGLVTGLNASDLKSIISVGHQYFPEKIPKGLTKIPGTKYEKGQSPSRPLSAGLQFAQQAQFDDGTYKPTLLWAIAENACGDLEFLNDFIEQVYSRQFGQVVNHTPMPSAKKLTKEEQNQRNEAVGAFVQFHPACDKKIPDLGDQVYQFLNIMDTYQPTGAKVRNLTRVLGLEGILPHVTSGSSARVAGLTLAPLAKGRKDKLYYGLLWKLLGTNCAMLETYNQYINDFLSGNIGATYQKIKTPSPTRRSTIKTEGTPKKRGRPPALKTKSVLGKKSTLSPKTRFGFQ